MYFRELHVCEFPNCSKSFRKKSRYATHMRSHTQEKPYVCKVEGCGKAYTRVDHLGRHMKTSHKSDDNEKEWFCDASDCDSSFTSQESFKKHKRLHHGKQSYKCHISGCEAEFRKHHQLKQHKHDVHNCTTSHRCPESGCGKTFPFPNKLRTHMKSHGGYACVETGCNAKFDKWSLLVKHRRVNHAPVHKCQQCDKVFKQKQWLRQHMFTHVSDRTVIMCSYDGCQREYLDQRNLNAHIRSYHEGKKFPCQHEDCDRSFVTKQKLEQHKKMHDPNRPLPKKPKPKKKRQAEKMTGVSLASEGRGQDAFTFTSPNREDSIELPELDLCYTSNAGDSVKSQNATGYSNVTDDKLECGDLGSTCTKTGDNVNVSDTNSVTNAIKQGSVPNSPLMNDGETLNMMKSATCSTENSKFGATELSMTAEEMIDSIYEDALKKVKYNSVENHPSEDV